MYTPVFNLYAKLSEKDIIPCVLWLIDIHQKCERVSPLSLIYFNSILLDESLIFCLLIIRKSSSIPVSLFFPNISSILLNKNGRLISSNFLNATPSTP